MESAVIRVEGNSQRGNTVNASAPPRYSTQMTQINDTSQSITARLGEARRTVESLEATGITEEAEDLKRVELIDTINLTAKQSFTSERAKR